ncbi:MAG: FAD:protein FMN transferase [Paenibacillaceae bacterium]
MVKPQIWEHAALHMDTVVQMKVVSAQSEASIRHALSLAFAAFCSVEEACSRFDHKSELRHLMTQIDIPVAVSPILFEALRFAWEVASLTDGAFDPTVGHIMEAHGFNHHYLTGEATRTAILATISISYLDILLDEEQRTVRLLKPMVIDLGAVAKGLAIDLAKKELQHFEGFIIDAGGDVWVSGLNERAEPWLVGVRHPIKKDELFCTLNLTDAAICTSGNYERLSTTTVNAHHLMDPKTQTSAHGIISCTVVAPYAMMADAFSTAALILGAEKGLNLLENIEIDGLCITSSLEVFMTRKMQKLTKLVLLK